MNECLLRVQYFIEEKRNSRTERLRFNGNKTEINQYYFINIFKLQQRLLAIHTKNDYKENSLKIIEMADEQTLKI